MKYKTINGSDRTILQKNGDVAVHFKYGEYIKGNTTTDAGAAYVIDATAQTNDRHTIVQLYPLAADGGAPSSANEYLQCAGMVDFTVPTDPYYSGKFFYKAPTLTSSSSSSVDGLWYKVLTGTAINDGVTYTVGEIFQSVGTTVTGTGTFELEAPPICDCSYDREAEFKKKLMNCGDEVTGIGTDYNGFTPQTSNNYLEENYFGSH
jgi:hypothetical protein